MQPADTTADRDRRPRRRRAPALAAAAALAAPALLVAGCGGGGHSPGVAKVANSHTTSGGSSTTGGSSTNSGGSALGGSAPPASSGGRGSGPQAGFAIAGGNRTEALKLSECMRANGVPNFPDPNAQGVIQGTGINPTSPSFGAAMNKCKQYTPHGGQPPSPQQQAQFEADALKYSECMRAHGVTGFPDPQFSSSGGGFSIRIGARNGSSLDPNSPIYQAAQKACQSNLPFKGAGLKAANKVGT